jgi:hypothetical protein
MFYKNKTLLINIYLHLLLGDPSTISNMTYKNNPSLVLLIILYTFLVVIYLMNLFIGLLSNVIEEDNNRSSYLIQKAEVYIIFKHKIVQLFNKINI